MQRLVKTRVNIQKCLSLSTFEEGDDLMSVRSTLVPLSQVCLKHETTLLPGICCLARKVELSVQGTVSKKEEQPG